jgi:eukaryotic-like serine/threonine-protein kinase
MSLSAGARIGSYEVLYLLGKGGMGEVYRARDTKLDRDAALKLLPDTLMRDQEYLTRFQREARALASLSHPHVAQIYGLEELGERQCIVMEFIGGPTLEDRIRESPIALDEALELARQIAEALEAAHERGIIHRDLKPANIKITPEGDVKVLDFGLAKAIDRGPRPAADVVTASLDGTQAGLILGTAAYMSPEQAKGKPSDARSDIFAFGLVLYEMLTGRPAFDGETTIEVLGAVIRAEPDWSSLPETTPASIRSLLRRCLQKDRNRRVHHITDARLEIEEALQQPSGDIKASPPSRNRERLFWAAALLLSSVFVGVGIMTFDRARDAAPENAARFSVTLPTALPNDIPPLALSPDGSLLAYVSGGQLYVRAMNSFEAKPITGARPAVAPFFSPDGKWIGFFGGGKLRKVSVLGGAPEEITDAPVSRGASWGTDNTIYFSASASSGLRKVSALGGPSQEFTTLDRSRGEISHRFPQVLPGGKAVLFTVWTGPGWNEMQVDLVILSNNERRVVARNGHTGRYVPSGHVAYTREGALIAVPFDLAKLQVVGPPVTLEERLRDGSEGGLFAIADSGALAYVPGDPDQFKRRLAWIDRKGVVEVVPAAPRPYVAPELSPDGRFAAVGTREGLFGLWIYDFARNTLNPLTTPGSSQFPKWTPDGKYVVYRGTRNGHRHIYRKAADGSADEMPLTSKATIPTVGSVSKDGKWLAFEDGDVTAGTASDLWVLSLEGEKEPEVFLRTPASESGPRFSPDGRWISYASNESGRSEIYVRPFPGPGQKVPVSTNGGADAQWSSDGSELFYLEGRRMMAVHVSTTPVFTAGDPKLLFDEPFSQPSVSPDGKRFLVILLRAETQPLTQINVVTRWAKELK